MRLQHLMTLLAVAEAGSVTRAASVLNVAQSAVSRAVRELEASMGTVLLDRHAWGVSLTPAGQALIVRARAIRAEATAARREVAALRADIAPPLRIGAGPTAAAFTLPRALRRMQQDAMSMRITIIEANYAALIPQLLDGEIDAVLGPLNVSLPTGLSSVPLYTDQLVVVCRVGHRLLESKAVDADALHDAAWILPPRDSELWSELKQVFDVIGVAAPECVIESESVGLIRAMLQLSDALALLPKDLVRLDCQHGILEVVRTRTDPWRRPMGVIHRASAPVLERLAPLIRCLSEDVILSARK
jgi:DNA-binding transcriptional LysR family regulator